MDDKRDEKIRQRAYELWEQEGRPEGRHSEHWEQAAGETGEETTEEESPGPIKQQDPAEGDRATIERELERHGRADGLAQS